MTKNSGNLRIITYANDCLIYCYNVHLRDIVSIIHMHTRASLLSLEQRWQKQLLCLTYIHKHRFNVAQVHEYLTRADQVFTFAREKYNCVKYKNSPYNLPVIVRNSTSLLESKKHLNVLYTNFDNHVT